MPSPRELAAKRRVAELLVKHARSLVSSQASAKPSANSMRLWAARQRVN